MWLCMRSEHYFSTSFVLKDFNVQWQLLVINSGINIILDTYVFILPKSTKVGEIFCSKAFSNCFPKIPYSKIKHCQRNLKIKWLFKILNIRLYLNHEKNMINKVILTHSQSKLFLIQKTAYFFKVGINMHEKCKRPWYFTDFDLFEFASWIYSHILPFKFIFSYLKATYLLTI